MKQIIETLIQLGLETRIDDNGRKVGMPLQTFDTSYGGAVFNEQNGWGEYNKATRVVPLVSMTEFIGLSYSVKGLVFRLRGICEYKDFITQPPTKENLEDIHEIVDYEHLFSNWFTMNPYKTIEQAINDGVKIYLKID